MNLQIIKGNLFTSTCQTLVNTINCVGVMGAGIALEFRLRYPEMYERYIQLCQQKEIDIGKLWIYKTDQRWILNFPTKKHWKYNSELRFLELGLHKFIDTYESKGITSIAFPMLGTQNGGISVDDSLAVMKRYLSGCSLPVEIYLYDPTAPDDIFTRIKERYLLLSDQEITEITALKQPYIKRVRQAIQQDQLCSLAGLLSTQGIGISTVEKTLLVLK
ncbi:MAG: macro domain-containing protein [Myxacorys californica WJT36-NPBG1]|jgi:O-acetyl-ADP-ribose deacetylase (regulator of RNase III)|nr:macro domain-containing protein [Myxacorys californica WJT36-NPBG1]